MEDTNIVTMKRKLVHVAIGQKFIYLGQFTELNSEQDGRRNRFSAFQENCHLGFTVG